MPAMNDHSSSSSYNFSNIASSCLRSIHKIPSKPGKKPVDLPPQIRFYFVESSSFRELVQELTGAPKFQPNRFRHLAPSPINIIKPTPQKQPDHSFSEQIQIHQQLPQLQLQQQQQQQQLETQYEHHEIPSTVAFDISLSSPEPLVEVNNKNLFDCNSPSVEAAITSIGLMSPSTWNTWCSASSPLCSPGTSPEPLVEVNNDNLFDCNSTSVEATITSIGLMSPTTWNTWCSASSPLCSPETSPEALVEVNDENLFDSNSPSVAAAITSIGMMSPTTRNTWCSASSPICSPGTMFELFGV